MEKERKRYETEKGTKGRRQVNGEREKRLIQMDERKCE